MPLSRVRIGTAFLLAFVLVSDISLLARSVRRYLETPSMDEAAVAEIRLEPVRRFLRPAEVAGMVSDAESVPDEDRIYRLAQYALAPVLLTKGPKSRLVVGIFKDPGASIEQWRSRGLVSVRDFGGGVVLFESGDK